MSKKTLRRAIIIITRGTTQIAQFDLSNKRLLCELAPTT